jgi:hypothetical protein
MANLNNASELRNTYAWPLKRSVRACQQGD